MTTVLRYKDRHEIGPTYACSRTCYEGRKETNCSCKACGGKLHGVGLKAALKHIQTLPGVLKDGVLETYYPERKDG